VDPGHHAKLNSVTQVDFYKVKPSIEQMLDRHRDSNFLDNLIGAESTRQRGAQLDFSQSPKLRSQHNIAHKQDSASKVSDMEEDHAY
jgi:hypothetical protein